MKITADLLARDGACKPDVALVRATWPDGAEPTATNLLAAARLGLAIGWLKRYIPGARKADYRAKLAPLAADYWAKRDALAADYWAKRDALDADYRAKCAPLDADYRAKRDALAADCWAKLALLDADYGAKRAPLAADYWAKRDALLAEALADFPADQRVQEKPL